MFSAAAVVMSALAAGALAHSDPAPPAIASVGPLRVTYPSNLHRRYFSSCSFSVTGVRSGACVHGVVIASYPLKSNPELGASGATLRPDGVLFELYRAPSQEAYLVGPKLPLSLTDFRVVGKGMHPGEQRELFFRANGANYSAIAWIGKHATKPERDDLTGVIGSIQAAK